MMHIACRWSSSCDETEAEGSAILLWGGGRFGRSDGSGVEAWGGVVMIFSDGAVLLVFS